MEGGGGGELGTNESGVGGYEVYEESCNLPNGVHVCVQ